MLLQVRGRRRSLRTSLQATPARQPLQRNPSPSQFLFSSCHFFQNLFPPSLPTINLARVASACIPPTTPGARPPSLPFHIPRGHIEASGVEHAHICPGTLYPRPTAPCTFNGWLLSTSPSSLSTLTPQQVPSHPSSACFCDGCHWATLLCLCPLLPPALSCSTGGRTPSQAGRVPGWGSHRGTMPCLP